MAVRVLLALLTPLALAACSGAPESPVLDKAPHHPADAAADADAAHDAKADQDAAPACHELEPGASCSVEDTADCCPPGYYCVGDKTEPYYCQQGGGVGASCTKERGCAVGSYCDLAPGATIGSCRPEPDDAG